MPRSLPSLLLAFAAAFVVAGCIPVAVEVAQKVWEDRTTETQFRDARIHAGLIADYIKVDDGLPVDVNTDVWEGRVMLTGTLHDPALRERVEQIVRRDRRVRAVYDEIVIVPKEEQERRPREAGASSPPSSPAQESNSVAVGRLASDLWIEAKIKAQLLATDGVRSVNYRWQAVRNRVYVIGRAASEQERALVLAIIGATKGVLGVKDFIEVKPLKP